MQFPETPLREKIFSSLLEMRFFSWYRQVFSIKEIEESTALQWFFGATLLSFLATFNAWIGSSALTIQNYIAAKHTCWPWFPNCGEYYFLEMLPYGHSQTILYMVFFGIMALIVYLMYRKDWVLAHVLLFVLFLWKFLVMFVFTSRLAGNYDYYHIIFAVILLFFPLKLFFAKLSLVLFYTMSSTVKLHETWVLGTYFSALEGGLPIFPDWSIPVWTNLVIVMQIVGAWFLLSSNIVLQRLAFIFFVTFHLYSGVLVEYRYPLTVLPSLIILFGMFYQPQEVPLSKKSIAGWALVVALVFLQLSSVFIPGDERMTLEGNFYGMYMFEANHQCISEVVLHHEDGTMEERVSVSGLARNRCDPYRFLFQAQQYCERWGDIERISWTFDHSINGGPFYRVVDVEEACELEYNPLGRNQWIHDKDEAELIGYPVKNLYY